MRVSLLALGVAAALSARPAAAGGPPPPAAGGSEPADESDDAWASRVGENGGKLGVRVSTRRIFGIRTYGGEPTLLVGHRFASGQIGIYGSGAVFLGRTAAGLTARGHTVGVEVDVIHGRWFLDFGGLLGAVGVRRATTNSFLVDWVTGTYFGVGGNLAESQRGHALTLEQRSTIEVYGWLLDADDENRPLVDTLAFASSLFAGVSW